MGTLLPWPWLLRPLVAAAAAAIAAFDVEALVQGARRLRTKEQSAVSHVTERAEVDSSGPVVTTEGGPIRGIRQFGCQIFKSIPYGSIPERFAQSVPPQPWAPAVLDATKFGGACIGSHVWVPEREDCLALSLWVPEGLHTNMPVIVYFHGGMMQHGSGRSTYRHGDGIAQSKAYPTIMINFDFRLGIMGCIHGREEDGTPPNLWLHDQQQALRWVQRNIRAFGGDPTRVALQSESEGGTMVLTHLISPASAGLFSRAVMHSPVADVWSRDANRQHTEFIAKRVGCLKANTTAKEMITCLKSKKARTLWGGDWVAEELSNNVGSLAWITSLFSTLRWISMHRDTTQLLQMMGWHPDIDGRSVPGEARDLIAQGKWNKVPVLVTTVKNESLGVIPHIPILSDAMIRLGLGSVSVKGDVERLSTAYSATLAKTTNSTPKERLDLLHLMITDKMWVCDIRAMADDFVRGGGHISLGMFWYSPKFDPIGKMTNKACTRGAACHVAQMTFAMPQMHGDMKIHGNGTEKDVAFSEWYRDQLLAFVHGAKHAWAPYDPITKPFTFMDSGGPRVVRGYRGEQCDVLDSSTNPDLPAFLRRRGGLVLGRNGTWELASNGSAA
mmetsp:Transcript_100611/g.285056  ORF Transcript_100611/g.285056 Transcript_100611/m.285056 type:complete len:613 (+) Transcript_100611:84-1922(+)